MEQRIALASCFAILFNDNKLGNLQEHLSLIKETMANVVLPELISDEDPRSSIAGIKTLINKILNGDLEMNNSVLQQQIDIYCSADPSFQNTLLNILKDETPAENDDEIKKIISGHTQAAHNFNREYEIQKTISNISFKMNTGALKSSDALAELRIASNKYESQTNTNELPGFIGRVSSDDKEGIRSVFKDTKQQLEGTVLRTGWKGVNKMLGVNGGIVPGECIVMPALPHNAKTTFSFSMFLSFAVFNEPEQFLTGRWENKKPLLLDISLENELSVNLPLGYKMLKEHCDKVPVDIKQIDVDEATDYITDKLSEKGWTIKFERWDSSMFTIETLREIVARYEAEGYRIVAMRVDYLGVSNKAGLSNGAVGSEVREMYRRARNICTARKIALISPHQLSPAAKALAAMDPDGYVKTLPGKGMYDGCTTVDNEVDLEIFFGIVIKNGKSYLVIQRGKHRTIVETPISHRTGCMRFEEIGTLPWDLDTDAMYWLKSVNSDAIEDEADLFAGF